MYVTLSWDLFIIVFFALIMTYTFIIGKKEAVKIILGTYIAIVAVQGIGSLLLRFNADLEIIWSTFGLIMNTQIISMIKLFFFVVIILFLAVRGGVQVVYLKEESSIINGALTGIFGFATAGLLISTLLTFVAGVPLLDMALAQSAAVSPLIQQSQLMQLMILNQDLWFALPAFLLIGVGFLSNRS
ncbi:MAG: hypothetical protein JWM56_860 [Candidatus Peribacteria bacterium]|nr:hypothetical protein [Candidatus Peribacteria bacterium]